jgi:hypothetical protein
MMMVRFFGEWGENEEQEEQELVNEETNKKEKINFIWVDKKRTSRKKVDKEHKRLWCLRNYPFNDVNLTHITF